MIQISMLRHKLQLCTRTLTSQWSLMCAGRVVQDRSRQQHKNGPVDRLYLWKEWNTHTVVDASSTQVLTFPFSSSHNIRSLPPRIEPLVLLWISKNPTGGFPETHLAISHDERELTMRGGGDVWQLTSVWRQGWRELFFMVGVYVLDVLKNSEIRTTRRKL